MCGPWTIIKYVGPKAFQLDLKEYKEWKHDMFLVSLLEPYHESMIPSCVQPPPPPVNDEEDLYELEDFLDSKVEWHVVKYLVRWKGYSPDDITWEPWSNMVSEFVKDKMKDFHW